MPADLTFTNDPGPCSAVISRTEPTASDNCSGVTIESSHAPGSAFAIDETTIVNYTATDAVSKSTTLSFNVTVGSTFYQTSRNGV